jgi:hypothetical protein
MNPRQLRLVAGFITVFVLISFAPTLPDLQAAGADLLAGVDLTGVDLSEGLGNLLLVMAGGLVLSVGVIAARRKLLARPSRKPAARPSTARALARQESTTSLACLPESALARQLRKESGRGLRVPELARQFGLSQDAVRSAIGRAAPAPAAPKGSSFRSRQPASPVPAKGSAISKRRNPYQVMA